MNKMHRNLANVRKGTRTRRNNILAIFCVVLLLFLLVKGVEPIYRYSILRDPVKYDHSLAVLKDKNVKYTVTVKSFPPRFESLKIIVNHYALCPNVQEVVVVWDSSDIGNLNQDSLPVPVRVRKHERDSLNNRWLPDDEVATDVILNVDDDLLIPCADIMRGLNEWVKNPAPLHSYLPRLVLPKKLTSLTEENNAYGYEKEAIRAGEYNIVLPPALIYDKKYLEYYSSDTFEEERKVVDGVNNCDDILMNFVVAHWLLVHAKDKNNDKETQHAHFVVPTRRLDISKSVSCGISCAPDHVKSRLACIRSFAKKFTSLEPPLDHLPISKFKFRSSSEKPWCLPFIGCVYL